MTLTIPRQLPPEIRAAQDEIEERARSYGLDFFKTIFEVVDYEEMSMLAAFGGFPLRYPHWRFGAEYDELTKGYAYGLQKIYEMVINTDPCYAYLLHANQFLDQKLVIAHVYGHCDFFKNNAWFAPTNRKMLDEMANHSARVNRYCDRFGAEAVEVFIDACLSLEDLIDAHAPHIRRSPAPTEERRPLDPKTEETQYDLRFPSKGYMDSFINPPEVIERQAKERQQKQQEKEDNRSFPAEPVRDVLLFLLEHAPLKDWQRDVLAIIRDEAYYFAPQGQTKIMNEGWASYWHSTIMTRHGLTDAEVVDYADHHSGTMATSPHRLNPYKLGIELFRDIEERWNTGRFGPEFDACDDLHTKEKWDKQLGLGRRKDLRGPPHLQRRYVYRCLSDPRILHQAQAVFLRLQRPVELLRDHFPRISQDQTATPRRTHQSWTPVHICRGRELQEPGRAVLKAQIPGGRAQARLRPRHAGQPRTLVGTAGVHRNDRRRQADGDVVRRLAARNKTEINRPIGR